MPATNLSASSSDVRLSHHGLETVEPLRLGDLLVLVLVKDLLQH